MATTIKGRGGSRSNWGKTSSHWAKSGWDNKGTGTCKTSTVTVPSSHKSVNCCLAQKIDSYKKLYNQTRGPAKYSRPTTTTINSFTNLIDKGCTVQTVSCSQIANWARSTRKNFNSRTPNTTACKTVLWAKFGKSCIKAVARTKSGSYMVACGTNHGKPFCFPK